MKKYGVDKNQTALLQVTCWCYLAGIVFLGIFNTINFLRGTGAEGSVLSGESILLVSVILTVYMLYQFFRYTKIIKRMRLVKLCIDGEQLTGIAIENPGKPDRENPSGETFSLNRSDVADTALTMLNITARQTVQTLQIITKTRRYNLPALEDIQSARHEIGHFESLKW